MRKIIAASVVSALAGAGLAILCIILYKAMIHSSSQPVYANWSWDSPVSKEAHQLLVAIEGRVWADANGGIVAPAKRSLEVWQSGLDPVQVALGAFRITDSSVVTVEWWTKMFSGAECKVLGNAQVRPDGLLALSRVDSVTLISGIPAKIEEVISTPPKFHGLVLRVKGKIGSSMALPDTYLFPPSLSPTEFDATKGIRLEHKFASPPADEAGLAMQNGASVEVDAVYHRPWKDDPNAPNGSFVALHRVRKLIPK